MTICINDVYRNEEAKWPVFGVKHPDEKPMVLLIKKGQKSKEEPIVIRGNRALATGRGLRARQSLRQA